MRAARGSSSSPLFRSEVLASAVPQFTGELVTVIGQGERRITVENIGGRPSHLALLPGSRFLLVSGRPSVNETDGA